MTLVTQSRMLVLLQDPFRRMQAKRFVVLYGSQKLWISFAAEAVETTSQCHTDPSIGWETRSPCPILLVRHTVIGMDMNGMYEWNLPLLLVLKRLRNLTPSSCSTNSIARRGQGATVVLRAVGVFGNQTCKQLYPRILH